MLKTPSCVVIEYFATGGDRLKGGPVHTVELGIKLDRPVSSLWNREPAHRFLDPLGNRAIGLVRFSSWSMEQAVSWE